MKPDTYIATFRSAEEIISYLELLRGIYHEQTEIDASNLDSPRTQYHTGKLDIIESILTYAKGE